jgi:hypothetical protein
MEVFNLLLNSSPLVISGGFISVRRYTDSLSITMRSGVTQMSNQKYRLLAAPIYRRTLAAARREIVSPNPSTCGGVMRPCRVVGSGVRNFFQLHDPTLRTARADICLYVASDEGFECFSKVLPCHDQPMQETRSVPVTSR